MIQQALEYLRKGFSVIPISPETKRPPISWKEFQTRLPTESEVEEWFTSFPNAMVGMVTGKVSGVFVIDLDAYKEGFNFDVSLLENETLIHETASGGFHYFYKYPTSREVRNHASKEENWDVRGDGGIIVLPPTIRNGKHYKVFKSSEIAEAPQRLLDIIKEEEKSEQIENINRKKYGGTIFDQLKTYPIGEAFKILSGTQWVQGDNFTFEKRSGGGYYIKCNNKPCNAWIDKNGVIGSGTEGVNGKTATGSIINWLEWYGNDSKDIAKVAKELFKLKNLPFIIEKKSDTVDSYTWGLDEIDEKITTLKKGQVSVLAADENQGKSTFSFWFARQNKKKHGHNVVYYSLESTKSEIHKSIAANSVGLTKIQYRDNDFPPQYHEKIKRLEEDESVEIIGRKATELTYIEDIEAQVARKEKIDPLILDNLTCIATKEANENESAKIIMQKLISIAERGNFPIVLVHHYRKRAGSSTERFRDIHSISGSRVIKDLACLILQISRTKDAKDEFEKAEFHIREGKDRMLGRPEEITIYFDKGEFYPNFNFSKYNATTTTKQNKPEDDGIPF